MGALILFGMAFAVLVGCGNSGPPQANGAAGGATGTTPTSGGTSTENGVGGAKASETTRAGERSGGAPATGGSSQTLGGFSGTTTVTSGGMATGGVQQSTSSGPLATGGGTALTDTANCPAWPQSKVFPDLGLHFYGPDPGPCTSTSSNNQSTSTTTYTYANGLVTSANDATSSQIFNWTQGVLTSYSVTSGSGTQTGQFTWGADSVTDTMSVGIVVKYVLSQSGYVLEQWMTTSSASGPVLTARYEYENCRLARRVQLTGSSAAQASATYTFEYDAVGHIIKKRFGDGSVESYGYSCW